MAETLEADAHDFHRGEMPVEAQAKTFQSIMGMLKVGSLIVAVLLTFLVMWLCAHAGFFPSAACAVILAIAGGVFLARGGGH